MKKKLKIKKVSKGKQAPTVMKEAGDVRADKYEGKNGSGADKKMMDNYVESRNGKKPKKKVVKKDY